MGGLGRDRGCDQPAEVVMSGPVVVVLAAGRGTRFRGPAHKLEQRLGDSSVIGTTLRHVLASRLPMVVVATAATADAAGLPADLDSAQLHLSSKHYLYLSGTPFRALTEGEFNEDAIYNWTYPDEQYAKKKWTDDPSRDPVRNPYLELPQMQMFTYALSEMGSTAIDQGADGLFDLSGYFEATKVGPEYHFADPDRVVSFLNMLRGRLTQSATEKLLNNFRPPFPYSDARFTAAVEHSVWFLPTVASAYAMRDALEAHPFFKDFLVHVAAGSAAKMGAEAKVPVDAMLARAAKLGKSTITLSVGKLMTGVTVPQWGAILILRSLKSPESYFQAAFRVQSPWASKNADGTRTINKHTCFVFEFDPNRALTLVYQYGTKLAGGSAKTSPADVIEELIEFLPIFAFDGGISAIRSASRAPPPGAAAIAIAACGIRLALRSPSSRCCCATT